MLGFRARKRNGRMRGLVAAKCTCYNHANQERVTVRYGKEVNATWLSW